MYHDFNDPEYCNCDQCRWERGERRTQKEIDYYIDQMFERQALRECSMTYGKIRIGQASDGATAPVNHSAGPKSG